MDSDIKNQIKSYYDYWFSVNSLYEKWAKKRGLTSNSLFVLYTISEFEGECNQRLICEKLFLPKQTINTILDTFEKKGFVQKIVVEKDKRNKYIVFTETGHQYADEILLDLYNFEATAFQNMNSENSKAMLENSHLFLKRLTSSLSENSNS